jgi:hypothetical protein
LLTALDGSGVKVVAETNSLQRIGGGPLRLVTDLSAVAAHPDVTCVDGLDYRQRQLLQQLQQPGERLPLVVVSAEQGSFRASRCAWVGADGAREVKSMADLKALVAAWDGREVPNGAWLAARAQIQSQVKKQVTEMAERYVSVAAVKSAGQREAARLRLVDELGRLLICYEPDTNDLNGKFHRLANEQTPTGHRLQTVFGRLGGAYPEWEGHYIADLRDFRAELGPSQVKSRLTGGQLDAALADPRWAMEG